MSYLRIDALECRFGGFVAVDAFNLALAEGEFVALLGPSGCGKTTTLRSLAGFIRPTGGTITVADRQLSGPGVFVPPERRLMSMIFQSYAIWPHMTVFENVAFGLHVRRLPRDEVQARTRQILEVVKLDQLADRLPGELSGGQQQRVALARAIVVEPKVLLLDEPLSNLDATLREEMRFEIRRLHNEFGITSVYVTHDQAEAMVTADRIVVMNKGHVEQVDAPFDLYDRPATKFVAGFIGHTNLIEGQFANGLFEAGPLRLPASGTPADAAALSIRPHTIEIGAAKHSDESGSLRFDGRIAHRAFLGDSWEYEVAVAGLTELVRVSRPPHELHAENDAVSLSVAPRDLRYVR